MRYILVVFLVVSTNLAHMIENKAHPRRFLVFVSRTSRIKLNITHRPLILEVTRIVYLIDLFVVASSSDNHHFIRSTRPVRSLFRSNLQIITRLFCSELASRPVTSNISRFSNLVVFLSALRTTRPSCGVMAVTKAPGRRLFFLSVISEFIAAYHEKFSNTA